MALRDKRVLHVEEVAFRSARDEVSIVSEKDADWLDPYLLANRWNASPSTVKATRWLVA